MIDRSNPQSLGVKGTLQVILKWLIHAAYFSLFVNKKRWLQHQIAVSRRLRKISSSASPERSLPTDLIDLNLPRAGWLGQSTCWAKWQNFSLITDPIWSQRCSPISFWGPSRLQAPSVSLDNFLRPTLILISHNHYDHLDLRTLRKLQKISPKTEIFAPEKLGEWLTSQGIFATSIEMGKSHRLECGELKAKITCTPAIHFSRRSPWDFNRTMWSSWTVEMNLHKMSKTLFFAGDTAYDADLFQKIGRQFSIDLSFLPIGAYEPRSLLKKVHINPDEAVKIHLLIGSKLSIACHHSTFSLGDPLLDRPLEDLTKALIKNKEMISHRDFLALEVGEEINW